MASVLCLDVSGAFDNVSHQRLLHNLRKRRISGPVAKWVASFLVGRKTRIRLPDYKSAPIDTNTGIPQGSGVSPPLYIFYNSDLVELCANEELNSTGIGFVDDVAMLVVSDTIDENNTKLATLYNDGCQTWATTHASRFDPDKFQLVHFLGRRAEFQEKPLVLRRPEGEITIPNKRYYKYLGALLDWKLHWDKHINHLEAKVSKKLAVLACLGGSTWGIGVRDLRQVYLLTILPQFQYYCSAWYIPDGGLGFKGREVRALKLMRNVQRRAARIIGGAFRSILAVALDVELHLPPVEDSIKRAISNALFRLASTPIYRHIVACRKTTVALDVRRAYLTPKTGRLNAQYARLSPLQKLEYYYWVVHYTDVRTLEIRIPMVTAPWWVGPEYHIAPDVDVARLAHDKLLNEHSDEHIFFYIDGSGLNDKIGALAVQLLIFPNGNTIEAQRKS